MAERRFSDRDINAIIKRAGELQLGASSDKSTGATLEQIQQAAAELGITPDMVAKAAQDVDSGYAADATLLFLGGPIRADFSRVAKGAILEQDVPGILKEIRRVSGRVGFPKSIGNALEWQSNQPDGLHVVLTPEKDHTTIDVRAAFGAWTGLCIALPMTMACALGAFCLGEGGPVVGAAVGLSLLIGSFLLGRSLYAGVSQKAHAQAAKIAECLVEYVEREAKDRPRVEVVVTSEPKIHQTIIG